MSDPKDNAFPAIPEPTPDPKALAASVRTMKEIIETLLGRRGLPGNAAVLRKDKP